MADTAATVGKAKGQKPVHQTYKAQGYLYPQDAVWEAIRALKKFSCSDVAMQLVRMEIAGINESTIESYIARLQRGCYVEHVDTQLFQNIQGRHIYALVNDVGREAPRLREDGTLSTQGLGNDHMWRAMKVLGEFTYRELMNASTTDLVSVSAETAKTYCRHLQMAGYLAVIKQGGPNVPARYRLLPSKITGPRPPMVQRTKRIFDPNLKKIVWREDV